MRADSQARLRRLPALHLCTMLGSAQPLCNSVGAPQEFQVWAIACRTHKGAAVSGAYSVSTTSILRMNGCSLTERVLLSDSGSVVVKLRLARLFWLRS